MGQTANTAAREAWAAIVFQTDPARFAASFDPKARLTASVCERVLEGPDAIRSYFEATRAMFDRFVFTGEVEDGGKVFMAWEGEAFEHTLTGVTILDRDPAGRVTTVEIYSGPLASVTPFSVELQRRLSSRERASL